MVDVRPSHSLLAQQPALTGSALRPGPVDVVPQPSYYPIQSSCVAVPASVGMHPQPFAVVDGLYLSRAWLMFLLPPVDRSATTNPLRICKLSCVLLLVLLCDAAHGSVPPRKALKRSGSHGKRLSGRNVEHSEVTRLAYRC